MNYIQELGDKEFSEIRIIEQDGEPWFIGKDICNYFDDSNHNRTLKRVDDIDKQVVELIDSMGRKQSAIAVNESGMYTILFTMQPQKAHKDEASDEYPIEIRNRIEKLRRFKHWVTSEVLPSIRKTGGYQMPQTYAEALRALADKAEEAERLAKQNEEKTALIETLQPKASYYDTILNCKGVVSTTEIAKDYGMSAKKFNKILFDYKIQFKQSGRWFLYAKYEGMDYARSKTHPITRSNGDPDAKTHMYWTQKGRLFLYHFLKDKKILPMVEWEGGCINGC